MLSKTWLQVIHARECRQSAGKDLAASGATTKQFASQLTVSPRTVDTHLRNLVPKLGVTSRAALSEALRQLDSALDAGQRHPGDVGRRVGVVKCRRFHSRPGGWR